MITNLHTFDLIAETRRTGRIGNVDLLLASLQIELNLVTSVGRLDVTDADDVLRVNSRREQSHVMSKLWRLADDD